MATPCYGCKNPPAEPPRPVATQMLIVMQYYSGDRALAERSLRLMVDLEEKECTFADILLSRRIDCPPPSKDLVAYLRRRFAVNIFEGRRHAKGWPNGPNEMFFDVMAKVFEMTQARKWNYKAILTLEADDTPITRDWLHRLSRAWDQRRGCVMGDLQLAPAPHINGNALFSGDIRFLKFIRDMGGCHPAKGWDYDIAADLKRRGWTDTPLIRSDWGMPTAPEGYVNQLLNEGVVLHHGCKDGSLIEQVRKNLRL